jgi:uncharacterized membrane protein YhaH (DUF805 family)
MAVSEMACPACAAPLIVNPASEYQRCGYCQSTLRIAPDASHTPNAPAQDAFAPDLQPTWQRLVALFIWPLGRVSRSHFIFGAGVLVIMLVLLSPFVPDRDWDKAPGIVGLLTMCICWSYAALAIKRYHDIGKSGWWLLIAMVPFGIFYQWYELFSVSGEPHPNQYGALPSQKAGDLLASDTGLAMGLRN